LTISNPGANEGFHSSKKEEADKMKPLLTETTCRCEKKFHEPQNLNNYHNYIGASNHVKALNVTPDCRRYAIYYTTLMKYGTEKWSELWDLVNNPAVREIFFQYLRTCVDISRHTKDAPMTDAKAAQAAEQCPVAIKWMKAVIMDKPAAAAYVPADVDDYELRAAWENDKHKMTFKSRGPTPPALLNLVGNLLNEALLKRDYSATGPVNSVKCVLPLDHVAKCVTRHFQGQSWTRFNGADLKRDFELLGINVKGRTRLGGGGPKRGLLVFPSIEGCMYLMKKKGWMTEEEAGDDDEEMEY